MHSNHDMLTARSLLRWGRLLTVVLAIIAGLLGMHVIGGAQASPLSPASMNSAVAAPAATTQSAAESAHAMPSGDTVAGQGLPSQEGLPAACSCTPSGCDATMAMHGGCVPTFGPTVLSVPLPGIHTQLAAPAVFAATPGHKSVDRAPDPPSLNQLSISRT
ncbi:DUF6153 family protein [Arthrobacter sp. STN4]|uniref:DUF6153 family protein n=1 Tax=Arthrobacter sp. STN4 TaxID=2923276 RepID=UPI00211A390A|nr:DUF6153 family protein [Arthrobacter sp. STN4]MCQ9164189.1 DUF6153 family protein [Arthrobacter sp. STN4]